MHPITALQVRFKLKKNEVVGQSRVMACFVLVKQFGLIPPHSRSERPNLKSHQSSKILKSHCLGPLQKNDVMKTLITAVFILNSIFSYAQEKHQVSSCNDTSKICGYYIIVQREIDLKLSKSINKMNARKSSYEYGINDLFINFLFIPLDSVSKGYDLASRLDNFCSDSKSTVFKVCSDPIFLKNYCQQPAITGLNLCKLTNTLRCDLTKTTKKTGEVYKVFYVEGYWTKIKVLNSPFERGQVGGLTATRCIKAGPKFFDLYFCTSVQHIKPASKLSEKGMVYVK